MTDKILVVDDEPDALELFTRIIERNTSYKAETCQNGETALAAVKKAGISVIIADYRMPGMDGLELLRKVREINSDPLFIMITGYGTIEIAVEAMKRGAFDFITKPIGIEQVLFSIRRAIDRQSLKKENSLLRQEVTRSEGSMDIVGISSVMNSIMKKIPAFIDQISGTNSSVLIVGENGMGKELVARAIHSQSARGAEPFVTLNWSDIPASLIEGEVFGYCRGISAGEKIYKRGMLSKADRGTVFFNEIGDIPLSIQVKLVRFMQESRFNPAGSLEPQDVDVRILAATNKEPEKLIQEGYISAGNNQ